jgi:PAS domain S-box-containing protein
MLYESQSTERLYDYEQNEHVSEHVTRYFHPEDYDHAVDAFATIVSTERHHPEAVEYHHRQADGSYTWIESVGSSNPTPAGNYILSRW